MHKIKNMLLLRKYRQQGCVVSNKIISEGWKVGYMYKEETTPNQPDSGWRFLKGDEDSDYMNKTNNSKIYSLYAICQIDPAIIPYLKSPIGSSYIRVKNDKFEIDNGTKDLIYEKQKRRKK